MRNYWNVFRFEALDLLKKKSTLIITLALSVIVLGVALLPMILVEDEASEPDYNEYQQQFEGAAYHLGALDESSRAVLIESLGIEDQQLFESAEELTQAITNEEYNVGFDVHSLLSFETIYYNRVLTSFESLFGNVLLDVYRWQEYEALGIDPSEIIEVENTQVESTVTILGRDSISNYFVTYILSFVVYFIVLMYGNTIASNVAREKDTRAMELLITSTRPTQLILGKVTAVIGVSLLQVACIVVSGLIGFSIAKGSYPEVVLMVFESSLTPDSIFVMIFFSLFGFFLYTFIYASLGSLVSRIEDLASGVMPITFVAMIALFLAMFSIDDVDGIVNRIASIVPFTSFIAMPSRYMLTVVSPFEMALAMGLLALTTVLFAYLSIRIYRWGTLHYGNRVGFFKALRNIFIK